MTVSDDRPRGRRAGYTLVEVMFASLFASLVLGQTILAFLWSRRIYQDTMAIGEFATATRALREKTLYQLVTGNGGIASIDLATCEVGQECKNLTFSIGEGQPKYTLSYDPGLSESTMTLAFDGPGEDLSAMSGISTREIKMEPRFEVMKLADGSNGKGGQAILRSEYTLSLKNGNKAPYERRCCVRSPIVNDFKD